MYQNTVPDHALHNGLSHFFFILVSFLKPLSIHIQNIRADRYWQLLQKGQRFQLVLKIFRCNYSRLLRTPPTSINVETSVLLYLRITLGVWMWLAPSVSLPLDWGTAPGTKGEHSPREQHLQPAGAENVTRNIQPCCWVSRGSARQVSDPPAQQQCATLCCWNRKNKETSFVGRLGIEAQSQYVELLANP